MGKVIRLTESQLKQVIKRIVKENEGEVNYDQVSNDLKTALNGNTTFFVPNTGGEPYAIKIENVEVPTNVMGKRVVSLQGPSGRVGNGEYQADVNPTQFTITYFCSTSNDKERGTAIVNRANLTFNNPQATKYKQGDGKLNREMSEYIEKNWCQMLPPSPGGGQFMSPRT